MKQIITMLLAVLLALTGFSSCTGIPAPEDSSGDGADRLVVVSTIFAPYDFTRVLAGDSAELHMLLPPGAESHSFEPTPQDIITIQNCDVFIYVGGESDTWVNEVLESMDTSQMQIVRLIDCVEAVEEEIVEGMEEEAEGEAEGGSTGSGLGGVGDGGGGLSAAAEDPEYDEHVWTSPANAKLIVQCIADALCAADPTNAKTYTANTEAYLAELDALDAELRAAVSGGSRSTLVFGDRFPFRYLADAYGLDYYAAFPGCSNETEVSATTVAFLIDKVEAEGIPVVFTIELSNGRIAQAIAEPTGAEVLEMHAAHSIGKADFESGRTYLDIMYANAEALGRALA